MCGCVETLIRSLPQLHGFCYSCIGLRNGCLIIGWLYAIVGLIAGPFVTGMTYHVDYVRKYLEYLYIIEQEWYSIRADLNGYDYEYGSNERAATFPVIRFRDVLVLMEISQAVFLIMNISHTLLAIFLLIGASQGSTKKMRIWLMAHMIMLIVLAVQTIVIIGFKGVVKMENLLEETLMDEFSCELIAFWIFSGGISIYGLLMVKSYYVETEEAPKNAQVLLVEVRRK